ncbi:MAG: helicase-related protein, partial [bacterium]
TLLDLAHAAVQKAESDIRSDDEKSQVEEDAVRHGGAWLRKREPKLGEIVDKLTQALEALGYNLKSIEGLGDELLYTQDESLFSTLAKKSDSKTERLVDWVRENLFTNGKLRDDERLIVFTEYKETLLYLQRRFQQEKFDENTMRLLYGGMGAAEFENVQREFEDPGAPVRLLLATDAASEGINMQECCRWVIHYDIPWSPTKILQRNGRVARHGQVRDVETHYFTCAQDEDMKFLFRIVEKVDKVRDDLGSVERVFDEALEAHMHGRDASDEELDRLINESRSKSTERHDLGHDTLDKIETTNERAHTLLESSQHRLGISPQSLVNILRTAIGVEGDGVLEDIKDKPGFYRLRAPARWKPVVEKTLTVGPRSDRMELVFNSVLVEEETEGRRNLRLKKHQVLMRLSHPVMRQAVATLSRQLHHPTAADPIYRWSVAALPNASFEAAIIFHYSLTAINELREPLHDEALSAVFRVEGDRLSRVEKSFENEILRAGLLNIQSESHLKDWVKTFRGKWFSHSDFLENFMKAQQAFFASEFETRAKEALKREQTDVRDSYTHRLKELKERSRQQELENLFKARRQMEIAAKQLRLMPELQEDAEIPIKEIDEQIAVLRQDVEQTRRQLEREQKQRDELLKKRYTIRDLRVLPLAVQYVVPASKEDLSA